jgi:beta-lactamase superfamily II metal-dependent hydrolase
MKIELFNVGHGSAALVIADNQNLMLLDCGHDDKGFRPSEYLPKRWRAIQAFIPSHYDSDHVSDLSQLASRMPIERLYSNTTIPVSEIVRLKQQEGPLSAGMQKLLDMKSTFGVPGTATTPDLSGIHFYVFYHSYSQFQDMNNLSLVTFVEYGDFSIIFPGDLERVGWLVHLENPLFRQYLSRVKVFVASHHGRDNGYCQDVFKWCKPELVIISDKGMQHDTQEHSYAQHASGQEFFRNGYSIGSRYVLTTRCDGHIVIEKRPSLNFALIYNTNEAILTPTPVYQ